MPRCRPAETQVRSAGSILNSEAGMGQMYRMFAAIVAAVVMSAGVAGAAVAQGAAQPGAAGAGQSAAGPAGGRRARVVAGGFAVGLAGLGGARGAQNYMVRVARRG